MLAHLQRAGTYSQVLSLARDCVDDKHAVDKLTEYMAVEKVGDAIQATLKLAQQLTTGAACVTCHAHLLLTRSAGFTSTSTHT